jgi:hypothetical protein
MTWWKTTDLSSWPRHHKAPFLWVFNATLFCQASDFQPKKNLQPKKQSTAKQTYSPWGSITKCLTILKEASHKWASERERDHTSLLLFTFLGSLQSLLPYQGQPFCIESILAHESYWEQSERGRPKDNGIPYAMQWTTPRCRQTLLIFQSTGI